jgi:hypothetical protein
VFGLNNLPNTCNTSWHLFTNLEMQSGSDN